VLDRVFAWDADTLVLGCTHYPLLRPALDRMIGGRILRVVDSADTTAARVSRVIAVNHLEAGGDASGPPTSPLELMVTADPGRFSATASRLFEETLPEPRLVRPAPPVIQLATGS
jgi:glutamate racemase